LNKSQDIKYKLKRQFKIRLAHVRGCSKSVTVTVEFTVSEWRK